MGTQVHNPVSQVTQTVKRCALGLHKVKSARHDGGTLPETRCIGVAASATLQARFNQRRALLFALRIAQFLKIPARVVLPDKSLRIAPVHMGPGQLAMQHAAYQAIARQSALALAFNTLGMRGGSHQDTSRHIEQR